MTKIGKIKAISTITQRSYLFLSFVAIVLELAVEFLLRFVPLIL